MPVSPDVITRKVAIRNELLTVRRALDPPTLAHAAASVLGTLQAAVAELTDRAHGSGPVIAAYAPAGTEPGGPDLPEALRRILVPPARLWLPVLREDHDLDWADYTGTLAAGRLGLREPPGSRLGPGAITRASVLVVPAVAVDRRGVRLGRGGGSYDRVLARTSPGTTVVALLHDGELRDHDLPAEPHDRRVPAAITPGAGFVRLRPE